jgi:Resolvase, N terminal domain
MLTVLGGLAEFERELIRTRTGEGRARAVARGQRIGAAAQAHLAPASRGDQTPRPGRGIARRHWPQLQRQRADDFPAGAIVNHGTRRWAGGAGAGAREGRADMAIVLDHTIVPAHDNEDGCQCLLGCAPF